MLNMYAFIHSPRYAVIVINTISPNHPLKAMAKYTMAMIISAMVGKILKRM